MTLDFSPRPAAAPAPARVWAHATTEAGLILRNGEQAILAIVIPLAVLVGAAFFGGGLGLGIETTAPSVLALAMWSSCLTTLAIATGFERRYNVLERLAATPLGRPGILAGKALAIGMITLGQVAVLSAAALALGWRPAFSALAVVSAVPTALLAMGAFAGMGLAISGSLRPEATLAVANLLYLVGMPLGVLLPVDRFPGWAARIVEALPTGALGEALRSASVGHALGWPLAVAALLVRGHDRHRVEGIQMDLLRKLVSSEQALRRWLLASLICNMGIIVTGAVVRLTGSGLGCDTWPKCSAESYVPHGEAGIHGAIEFGNRLLTFVLIAAALGAFITAWRMRGRDTKLWWITLGIGLGIPFQGVIGGFTVWSKLNPYVVALHLLLSVVLIVICVWALRVGTDAPVTAVSPAARWLVIATFAATFLSIWLGTVVTGSGPHAGDARAVRTGLEIETVARMHSLSAWLVTGLTVACVWLFHKTGAALASRAARLLLLAVLLQGAIGYLQYFLGIPAGVVWLHMVGLGLLTAAASWLLVTTKRRTHVEQPGAEQGFAVPAS
ncbi:MAG: COX15/CtaA family protein [Arachnia sp.]